MKKGDTIDCPSYTTTGGVLAARVEGFSKGNVKIRWIEGPLAGKPALLQRTGLQKSQRRD